MSFEANKRKINGLWPLVDWTDEERDLWTRRLQHLVQPWLDEALDEVATSYAVKKPHLKWVMDAYLKVRDAHRGPGKTGDPIEEGITASDRSTMIDRIESMTDAEKEEVKRKLKMTCDVQVDFSQDLAEWKNFTMAMVLAALEHIE
tara:strand:+ start:17657 stop:18094 length:438 start_codon:yes stop_codon:yes gene_type:complete